MLRWILWGSECKKPAGCGLQGIFGDGSAIRGFGQTLSCNRLKPSRPIYWLDGIMLNFWAVARVSRSTGRISAVC